MGIKNIKNIKLKNRTIPSNKAIKKVRPYMILKSKKKIGSPNDYIKHIREKINKRENYGYSQNIKTLPIYDNNSLQESNLRYWIIKILQERDLLPIDLKNTALELYFNDDYKYGTFRNQPESIDDNGIFKQEKWEQTCIKIIKDSFQEMKLRCYPKEAREYFDKYIDHINGKEEWVGVRAERVKRILRSYFDFSGEISYSDKRILNFKGISYRGDGSFNDYEQDITDMDLSNIDHMLITIEDVIARKKEWENFKKEF